MFGGAFRDIWQNALSKENTASHKEAESKKNEKGEKQIRAKEWEIKRNNCSKFFVIDLTDHIVHIIFDHLDLWSITSVSATCKEARKKFRDDNDFWLFRICNQLGVSNVHQIFNSPKKGFARLLYLEIVYCPSGTYENKLEPSGTFRGGTRKLIISQSLRDPMQGAIRKHKTTESGCSQGFQRSESTSHGTFSIQTSTKQPNLFVITIQIEHEKSTSWGSSSSMSDYDGLYWRYNTEQVFVLVEITPTLQVQSKLVWPPSDYGSSMGAVLKSNRYNLIDLKALTSQCVPLVTGKRPPQSDPQKTEILSYGKFIFPSSSYNARSTPETYLFDQLHPIHRKGDQEAPAGFYHVQITGKFMATVWKIVGQAAAQICSFSTPKCTAACIFQDSVYALVNDNQLLVRSVYSDEEVMMQTPAYKSYLSYYTPVLAVTEENVIIGAKSVVLILNHQCVLQETVVVETDSAVKLARVIFAGSECVAVLYHSSMVGNIQIWRIKGKRNHEIVFQHGGFPTFSFEPNHSVSHDGRLLAICQRKGIRVWDLAVAKNDDAGVFAWKKEQGAKGLILGGTAETGYLLVFGTHNGIITAMSNDSFKTAECSKNEWKHLGTFIPERSLNEIIGFTGSSCILRSAKKYHAFKLRSTK